MTYHRLLIQKILEKATNYDWSLQGMGMLRLYLTDAIRIHVWDSTYRIPNVSMIHSHPWNFSSEVIAGKMMNVRYTLRQGNSFNLIMIKCGIGAAVEKDYGQVGLQSQKELYQSGEVYEQIATEIHKTEAEDGTVTLVTRTMREDLSRDHAFMYIPKGYEFVSAEPRPATFEEVSGITRRALEKWF